jgi:hypothetical protein
MHAWLAMLAIAASAGAQEPRAGEPQVTAPASETRSPCWEFGLLAARHRDAEDPRLPDGP